MGERGLGGRSSRELAGFAPLIAAHFVLEPEPPTPVKVAVPAFEWFQGSERAPISSSRTGDFIVRVQGAVLKTEMQPRFRALEPGRPWAISQPFLRVPICLPTSHPSCGCVLDPFSQ